MYRTDKTRLTRPKCLNAHADALEGARTPLPNSRILTNHIPNQLLLPSLPPTLIFVFRATPQTIFSGGRRLPLRL